MNKQFYSTASINPSWQLPALGAQSNTVTVSGFSGGSSFATLLSAVEPERFDGFALLNGGIFGRSAEKATELIEQREQEDLAGPLSALANKPVYIFSGEYDSVVPTYAQEVQKEFYEMHSANVYFDLQPYNHKIPRLENCVEEDNEFWLNIFGEFLGNLWLRNCGHDTVGTFLAHLLENSIDPVELQPRNEDWKEAGVFKAFSQNFYLDDYRLFDSSGLAPAGYIYYPYACFEKSCRIHFYFHGCMQSLHGVANGWTELRESGWL